MHAKLDATLGGDLRLHAHRSCWLMLTAFIFSTSANAEMRCEIMNVQACEIGACKSVAPGLTFLVLDMENGRYGRCGGQHPCDWYSASFRQAGIYININFAPGPQGAKLSTADNTLIEVISGGASVLINRANCADDK